MRKTSPSITRPPHFVNNRCPDRVSTTSSPPPLMDLHVSIPRSFQAQHNSAALSSGTSPIFHFPRRTSRPHKSRFEASPRQSSPPSLMALDCALPASLVSMPSFQTRQPTSIKDRAIPNFPTNGSNGCTRTILDCLKLGNHPSRQRCRHTRTSFPSYHCRTNKSQSPSNSSRLYSVVFPSTSYKGTNTASGAFISPDLNFMHPPKFTHFSSLHSPF